MRSLILSVSTGAVLLASGCMFLPGYDFDAYLKDGASSTSSASGSSTMTGDLNTSVSSGGGAGPSTSTGDTNSTSSSTTTGGGPEVRVAETINQLVPADTTAFAADEQFVYWVSQGTPSQTSGTLRRDSVNGKQEKEILKGLTAVPWLIYDPPNRLYWIQNEQKGANVEGQIHYFDLGISTTGVPFGSLNGRFGYQVAAIGEYVYATGSSMLTKALVNNPGSTDIDMTVNPTGLMAVDTNRVYWADKAGIQSLGRIENFSSAPMPRPHGPGVPLPNGLGVSGDNVYWTAGDNMLHANSASAPTLMPRTINIKDAKDAFTKLHIADKTAYISTLQTVIAVNLQNSGQPAETPIFVVTGLHNVVSMVTNTSSLFIADLVSDDQHIHILKVKR